MSVAQTPDLDSTTEFINRALHLSTSYEFYQGNPIANERSLLLVVSNLYGFEEFLANKCKVHYALRAKRKQEAITPYKELNKVLVDAVDLTKVHFNLGDVDLFSVRIEETKDLIERPLDNLSISERRFEINFKLLKEYTGQANGAAVRVTTVRIPIEDRALAVRVRKAIEHAAELCGAKKPAF